MNKDIPYVGISANEMIKKLGIHFISTREGLRKLDEETNQTFNLNEYERKLYQQSEWEKSGNGYY